MSEAAMRRAHILTAADRLLRHYGVHKTTVADVAREAGVGVGSVYLEFPSKDAIVEALAQKRHDAVLSAMRDAARAAGRRYRDRLAAVFDARLEAYLGIAGEGAHACDLVHCATTAFVKGAPANPAVQVVTARFWTDQINLVGDLLHEGTKAGELDVPSPGAAATAILRAYAGFAPPWVAGRDRGELTQEIGDMHRVVLFGVVRREPSAKRKQPKRTKR